MGATASSIFLKDMLYLDIRYYIRDGREINFIKAFTDIIV